ncbi:vesicular mannose-binding lectin [Anaeramoeba flamelloides]|uniref:Vesicular mannose-binding lectin n=1 Tax=Anaeramoeba flamelloides TaxID=1746091 RepID=A0AAV7Z9E1_9EUKA|nr:vesicular mannose-binding lectin [Anaeramoeba flamelloides]
MQTLSFSFLFLSFLVFLLVDNKSQHDFFPPFRASEFSYNTLGSTNPTSEWLILTPATRNSKGSIWGQNVNQFSTWEAIFEFMIMGETDKGGEGLAFWYASDRTQEYALFGSQNKFTGLGVFLRTNPTEGQEHIQIMIGGGKKESNQRTNGANIISDACKIKMRNEGLRKIRVVYSNNQIQVFYDLDKNNHWAECSTISDINLPTGFYFGFSAETKENIDNHRLRTFFVQDLNISTYFENKDQRQQENNQNGNNNVNHNNCNDDENCGTNGETIFGIDIIQFYNLQTQYNKLLTQTEFLSLKVDKFTEAHEHLYSIEKFLNNLQLFAKQNSHDIFILKSQIEVELTQYISEITKDQHEVDASILAFRQNVDDLSNYLRISHMATFGIVGSIKDETIKLSEGVQQQGISLGWNPLPDVIKTINKESETTIEIPKKSKILSTKPVTKGSRAKSRKNTEEWLQKSREAELRELKKKQKQMLKMEKSLVKKADKISEKNSDWKFDEENKKKKKKKTQKEKEKQTQEKA